MALTQVLKCKVRSLKNTGYLRQLKRNEWVPAVIYGRDRQNLNILLAQKELTRIFSRLGTRGIFSLEIEGAGPAVMAQVKEVQKNHISGAIIHVDFLAVKMNEKIHTTVGIHLAGEESLIEKGVVLQVALREVPVVCLPKDLPEMITFDVSGLEIGSKITVRDLSLPPVLEIEDMDAMVASVTAAAKAEDEVQNEEPEETEGDKETGSPSQN
ncbi:MAG: 50S ribosomal protein L25 [Syntrophomonadaceae bacterium]|nr:50S ribosomal protein L25 [Syntrophomonadaceae bacterium]